jgi:hypothetical protein
MACSCSTSEPTVDTNIELDAHQMHVGSTPVACLPLIRLCICFVAFVNPDCKLLYHHSSTHFIRACIIGSGYQSYRQL